MTTAKTNNALSALLLFLLLMTINGCEQETEKEPVLDTSERFFAYTGQVKPTKYIITLLQAKNDSVSFAEKFTEKYRYLI